MKAIICKLCGRQLDGQCQKCQEGTYRGFIPAIKEPKFPSMSLSDITQAELNCLAFYLVQSQLFPKGAEDANTR